MTDESQFARRVAEVRRQCDEKILAAAPAIIDALIAQALGGSYQPAKFLFDFVDAAPVKRKDDEDDDLAGPSLAELVLERLELMEAEDAARGNGPESGATA